MNLKFQLQVSLTLNISNPLTSKILGTSACSTINTMWASTFNNHAVVCIHGNLKYIYMYMYWKLRILEVSLCLELQLNCLIFLLSCCRLSNIFGIFCFADSVCMDNLGRHCHCILTQLFLKLAK